MAVIAIGGGAYYVGLFGGDALPDRLLETPLPADSYEGWRLTDPPSVMEGNDPEPGRVGEVVAHLGRESATGSFIFSVFRTPAEATASFTDHSTFDAETTKLQQRFVSPAGNELSCFGGPSAAVCHALAGRTVVFARRDTTSVEDMTKIIDALAAHVSRLDR
ncbi:MAG: hypothetical protein AB7J63_01005 [Vicinamibacterales bacterium]